MWQVENSNFKDEVEESERRVIDFKCRGEGFFQKIYGVIFTRFFNRLRKHKIISEFQVWYDLPAIKKSKEQEKHLAVTDRMVRRVNGINELMREYSSRILSMRKERARLRKQIEAFRKSNQKGVTKPPKIDFFNFKKKAKKRNVEVVTLSEDHENHDDQNDNHAELGIKLSEIHEPKVAANFFFNEIHGESKNNDSAEKEACHAATYANNNVVEIKTEVSV